MALANHRRSIRNEITDRDDAASGGAAEALTTRWGEGGLGQVGIGDGVLSPGAWLFLMTGVPMMMQLEEGFGITTGHADLVSLFETYLDSVEPRARGGQETAGGPPAAAAVMTQGGRPSGRPMGLRSNGVRLGWRMAVGPERWAARLRRDSHVHPLTP